MGSGEPTAWITAKARAVDLVFEWRQARSRVAIVDDGIGMDDGELEQAMRLGDKSPLDARDSSDLGRFGLGLKTASFSQCRRLTVASKKAGRTSCLQWDLDVLARESGDGWMLVEGATEETAPWIDEKLASLASGTSMTHHKERNFTTRAIRLSCLASWTRTFT